MNTRLGRRIFSAAVKIFTVSLITVILLLLGPAIAYVSDNRAQVSVAQSSRQIAGLAPHPAKEPGAVIQAYAARTYGWRGAFAVHSWLAVKPANSPSYTVYEMIGWRQMRSGNGLAITETAPDRYWFGSKPQLLLDIRGDKAAVLIPKLDAAARTYPWATTYHAWPGPNSNTFVAYVARAVPELGLDLPGLAVGKNWLSRGVGFAQTPSGTGWQLSFAGLFGLAIGRAEGLEATIMGLTIALDPEDMAVEIPGVGRLGL